LAILAKQRILTLDYWKFAHDLKVGDYVFDKDGKLQRIKVVQEYRSEDCYVVYFSDGLYVAGDQHLGMQVEDKRYRDRLVQYKGKYKFKRPLKFKKVTDLPATNLKANNGRHLFSVPSAKPLEFPHQSLPVPPFVFGFWYMNHKSRNRITVPKIHSELVRDKFKDAGYSIKERTIQNDGGRSIEIYPKMERHLDYSVPHLIPTNYLLASADQRLELLKGILHCRTKTYSKSKDEFRLTFNHRPMLTQMDFLIRSLGYKTRIDDNPARNQATLFFRSPIKLVEQQRPRTKPVVHITRRYIIEVTKLPPQLCVHIETEGADNSILVGEGFIAAC
jgi:hypothetical protein